MDNNCEEKVLLVKNRIDELAVVARFLDELGEQWDLPLSLVLSLNLVLEEALANTIMYGFDDDGAHTIEIHFSKIGS
ncbi:MAG: hypothetical protein Q8S04_04855, partial [Bacteroidales bacterium]|nr:hypothetical protein [Bacteroidales bacterium]